MTEFRSPFHVKTLENGNCIYHALLNHCPSLFLTRKKGLERNEAVLQPLAIATMLQLGVWIIK